MKTGQFCGIVGVSKSYFQSLRERGCLPFDEIVEPGVYLQFSDAHLHAWLLAEEVAAIGMSFPSACRIVPNDPECAARLVEAAKGMPQ